MSQECSGIEALTLAVPVPLPSAVQRVQLYSRTTCKRIKSAPRNSSGVRKPTAKAENTAFNEGSQPTRRPARQLRLTMT